ncbi:CTP--molybdopterin cytidylyltransferase [Cereibacter changlensis JA139]|uniref:CTP--molybdopterin cytidylyltransferase n=2 Tax=Cereibacter changlensis TaxID=402884 RepID=A0A2T4K0C3_9RHOB|nr:NTP transferase domain-containing protein [Cereibacter changlensis]PTE23594.1 CTP--molybdopterin cytidylyltransferase [Cereibacter changlensis JA139]PZX54350.1 CTP:molybdopterin cytidylyltransferase MocA [Cereibacter changlensis]
MAETAPSILILAAGASSRMRGADKLLEPVEGVPLLRLLAQRALATEVRVLVALPPDRPSRTVALEGLAVERTTVAEAAEGMAAALRVGAAAVRGPLMVLLGDLPEITTEDLQAMLKAGRETPEAILRATSAEGQPGHPILFPPALLPELMRLTGDTGARALLAGRPLRLIALPGRHATTDLDTPEDWAVWRAARDA